MVHPSPTTPNNQPAAPSISALPQLTQQPNGLLALLATLAQSHQLALVCLDAQLCCLLVNARFCELSGASASQQLGQSLASVAPALGAALNEPCRQVFASGQPLDNLTLTQPNGRARWSARVLPVPELGALAVLLAELPEPAAPQLELLARLAGDAGLLFREAPFGLQIYDRQGTSLWMNEAQRRLLGLPSTSFGVGEYNVLTDPWGVSKGYPAYFQRAYGGEITPLPELVIDLNETAETWSTARRTRVIQTVIFPLHDASGKVHAVASCIHDVSERVEAQSAVGSFNAELEQLVAKRSAELAATVAQLEAEVAARRQAEQQLRINEENLRVALDALPMQFWMRNREGRNVMQSARSIQVWGDLRGKTLAETALPDEVRAYWQSLDKRVEAAQTIHEEHTYRINGEERIFEELATQVPSGLNAGYAIGIRIDITERKQIEARLHEQERLFRLTFDQSMIGTVMVGLDARFLRANERYCQIVGYSADELLQLSFVQLTHPDDVATNLELQQELLAGASDHYSLEKRYLRKNGEIIWVQLSVRLVRDEQGRPAYFLGQIDDITARRAAILALGESERRFRQLAEHLPDFVCLFNLEGQMTYSNRAQYLGYNLAELGDGALLRMRTHPDDRELAYAAWVHLLGAPLGTTVAVTFRFQRADGGWEWVQYRGISLAPADQGGSVQLLIVSSVITALKQAEDARVLAERQLMEAQKLESLGVLAGGIAHDFNNLLTAILGHAELVDLELPPGAPTHANVAQIIAGASHAAALTRQILTYAGRAPHSAGPVSLNTLLREMAELIGVSLPKHVSLRYELAPSLPQVEADDTQLRQVVLNLITNAAEAVSPPAGTIVLRTATEQLDVAALMALAGGAAEPGLFVRLEVADNGRGMDAATVARVFEPFFSTKFTGRGLGLSVVLGVVRGHRGLIEIQSAPGAGTTVRVWFLAAQGAEIQVAPHEKPSLVQRRGSVLLLDDEEAVRIVTARMLERLGFSVEVAPDGERGLAVLRAGIPGLVLVLIDMTMPGMSGEAVARIIRDELPQLPVILMSGYGVEQIDQARNGLGPGAVLAKPFTLESLRAAADQALADS